MTTRKSLHAASRRSSSSRKSSATRISLSRKKLNTSLSPTIDSNTNAKMGDKMNAKMGDKMNAKMLQAKMNSKMGDKMNGKMLQAKMNSKMGDKMNAKMLQAKMNSKMGDKMNGKMLQAKMNSKMGDKMNAKMLQAKMNSKMGDKMNAKMGDKMNAKMLQAKMNSKMGDKMNAKMGDKMNAKMNAKMGDKMNAKMGDKMNAKMLQAKMNAKMGDKMLNAETNTPHTNEVFTRFVNSPFICSTQYPELIRFLVTNDAYFGPETDQDAQDKDISVTARSKELYYKHLFPDYSTEATLTKHVSDKRIIDIGCGYNPLYECSFIHHFKDKARVEGMDIIPLNMPRYKCVSLFELSDHCKANSVDVLLVNNVLYFWIRKAQELQAAFEQMYKVLASGGEARIFPVYTAHQSMFVNDEALETYVNEHFFYRLVQPDYSDEDPYFQDKTSADVIHLRGCGKKEVQINRILKSKTLILKKL